MIRTGEAQERLEREFGIKVTRQTMTAWVKTGKVAGLRLGGRYYVDWDALVAMLHAGEDNRGQ